MIALLAVGLAQAGPLAGDVQVVLYDDALDVAAQLVEGLDPSIDEPDLGAAVSCWDRVGVRDFNLDVPIDLVGLSPGAGTLTVYVGFGPITGADMTVYGEDEDWTDLCPEFETALHSVSITDAELVATVTLAPAGGGFSVGWTDAPLVYGDLTTDFEDVPDDEVLYFVEDTLRALVADELQAALPPLLDEALAEAAFQGDYDGLAVDMALSDVDLTPQRLGLAATGTVRNTAPAGCPLPPDPGAPEGRAVALPLDDPAGAALGVGLTEGFTNALLHTSWSAGAFCFGSESADTLADRLAVVVDPDIATFEVQAVLGAPPVLTLDDGGMSVSLSDLALTVTGRSDGGSVRLVDAELDLSADATVGFAPSLTALTLSLSDLQVDFRTLALQRVLPAFADDVEPLLEDWLAGWLEDELQELPVFSSLYYGLGWAIVVDEARPAAGGLELWLDLADPADLDQTPPDTAIESLEVGQTSIAVAWSAEDDAGGPLAWSWQVDDGAWSAWTNAGSAEVWALPEGDHVIRVQARDAWLNVDPTPAERAFTLSADNPRRGGESCAGCASSGRSAPAWGILGLLLVGLRRRPGRG